MQFNKHTLSVAIALAIVGLPYSTYAMTVEEAYMTLSHHRPMFNPTMAHIADDESLYLRQLFDIIDRAVRERVQTMAWLQSTAASAEPSDQYNELISRLWALQPPSRLAHVHQVVREAIEEQRDVLRQWRPLRGTSEHVVTMQHPLVQDSSRKLHQVYDEIVQLFPGAGEHNRQAFYDYFCCLDFL